MTFKRDSICRENEEIIISILKDEGPMTIRDITKAVSGYEVGDSRYSLYARTITGILCHLLRKGHVSNDKSSSQTLYSFLSDLNAKSRPVRMMKEGEHIIYDFVVHVNKDGLIDRISKGSAQVRVFMPPEVTGRGIRTAVELPISADRFRKGLKSGRFITEILG